VLLEAVLGNLGILELDRAAEGIEAGRALVADNIERIERLLG
jgi:hypothetical protein